MNRLRGDVWRRFEPARRAYFFQTLFAAAGLARK
jgi:hypothetical protein